MKEGKVRVKYKCTAVSDCTGEGFYPDNVVVSRVYMETTLEPTHPIRVVLEPYFPVRFEMTVLHRKIFEPNLEYTVEYDVDGTVVPKIICQECGHSITEHEVEKPPGPCAVMDCGCSSYRR